MPVTFSLTLTGAARRCLMFDIYADLAYAAAQWGQYLDSNANIRVQVDVGGFPGNLGFIVQNDANDFVTVGTNASGQTGVEPWGEYALQTGNHVPGSLWDVHIYFNIDTNPDGATVAVYLEPRRFGEAVPDDEHDTPTMLLKALGYGLGFLGHDLNRRGAGEPGHAARSIHREKPDRPDRHQPFPGLRLHRRASTRRCGGGRGEWRPGAAGYTGTPATTKRSSTSATPPRSRAQRTSWR